ncbi:glucoamylase family protein [Penaeicola halotolerans]|uniref:glucoamylase family protein n=1 Tax=Penaeicola halotolerans TaxID=2793196 RepID=UPI001CF859BB|nr:glucoamylase family protein [Penaeicola halotolerans]
MKKSLLYLNLLAAILTTASCQHEKSKHKVIAKGYDQHVELHWDKLSNTTSYEVYLSTDNGDKFTKRATVKDTVYLDFLSDLGSNLNLQYQIKAVDGSDNIYNIAQISTRTFTDEELLDMVQYYTFRYFWDGAEPNSGLARERYHMDGVYPQNDKNIVTTGGSGFGIFGLLAGIERGWITKEEGLKRFQKIVSFLASADRFHGVWPHWLDGETGKVKAFSPKDDGGDTVESAFLMQGLLAVREYYKNGTQDEQLLAMEIDKLWKEMEWDWYTQNKDVLYWHWSPNYNWEMNFPLEGYNECLITYILAASSPTHTISADAYHKGWARDGQITANENPYGIKLNLKHNYAEKLGGPLFWAHYSFIGLDPRGLEDQYTNYFDHNRNHTLINRAWCVENSNSFEGYGEDLWGLTSSYSVKGYAGHKPGEQSDLGVISPTAALSSIVYTPDESMDVIKNLYYNYGKETFGLYGFYDALSPKDDWYPQRYLAIDQGPIVAMIENYRSQLGWKLFMNAPEIKEGLRKLGFVYDPNN